MENIFYFIVVYNLNIKCIDTYHACKTYFLFRIQIGHIYSRMKYIKWKSFLTILKHAIITMLYTNDVHRKM